MIYERFLGGVLCHHGVKGMKWGVRRTPEQLGHAPKGKTIEKSEEPVTIVDGVYHSKKGFTAAQAKFASYCLKPGTEHADEFFSVGYSPNDSERLFRDMEAEYDISRKQEASINKKGEEKFSIPMNLGIEQQKEFRTVWQIDEPGDDPRFITAYIDRRMKED